MKKNIHPSWNLISAHCSCGNSLRIYSTLQKNINLDVCAKCHPFYTGKQRDIISGSRINLFNKKFNIPY